MCHIGHQIFVSKICCTSPFCPPELWILIQGNLRLVVPELLAKASEKTDGMRKSITPHNITHFVNKWICFDSMCMSDRVTCSLPIWTSSTPLPKRAVIYGSWALHSCVLWCLIQGPTTRQGGERGCVGNSRGLRSSGTQELWFPINIPCAAHTGSVCVTAEELLHAGCKGTERVSLWFDSYTDKTEADTIKCLMH